MGPVMVDLKGLTLDDEECRLINNPLVGGVILFSRNFKDTYQLTHLIKQCKELKDDLIIAVDHEGGRVQRFREGFTTLPPMSLLGDVYESNPANACDLAFHTAIVLASELKKVGINLSFTPVLDINYGRSEVIGNRSFSFKPEVITLLNIFFIKGLHFCGFPSIGKHFPGHGYVNADSHLTLPTDERLFSEIINNDLLPYKTLINTGLDAVMPAHVVYKNVDPNPAGFSKYWLQDILRNQLNFHGVIFSDDLAMEGAVTQGSPSQRARAAFNAGCDMVLICNKPEETQELIKDLSANFKINIESINRLKKMMSIQTQSIVNDRLYSESLAFLKKWN